MASWNKKQMVKWYDIYAQDEKIDDDQVVSVPSIRYKFIAKDIERLVSWFGLCDDDILLDAGCGAGRFIYRIRKTGCACKIIAVDTSLNMIKRARRKVQDVDYLMADILHLPFRSSIFSAVICYSVLWHIPPQDGSVFSSNVYERGLLEFKRVLKLGGRVMFNTSNPFHPQSILEFFSSIISGKLLKRIGPLTYKVHLALAKAILDRLGFKINGIYPSGLYPILLETLCPFVVNFPLKKAIQLYYISFRRMEDSIIGRFLRNFAHTYCIKAINER